MVEKREAHGMWPSIYDPFRAFGNRLADWLNPATEASGSGKSYEISMELPGVAEKDVELTVDKGVLAISGEKRAHEEKKGDTWYFSERQYGAFRRSFRLPEDADGAKASATMKDGVLHISVPKLDPGKSADVRKITIS